jgi:hypothetical protein
MSEGPGLASSVGVETTCGVLGRFFYAVAAGFGSE